MAKEFKEGKLQFKTVTEENKTKRNLVLGGVKQSATSEDITGVRDALATLVDEPFNSTTLVETYSID